MQSGSDQHRTAVTRTTQQRGPHDDQRKPESSRQEHQAGGIDGKSLMELLAPAYMSDGWRPVCLAMRDSIRGPISSLSWNANTKSGQPSRASVR